LQVQRDRGVTIARRTVYALEGFDSHGFGNKIKLVELIDRKALVEREVHKKFHMVHENMV